MRGGAREVDGTLWRSSPGRAQHCAAGEMGSDCAWAAMCSGGGGASPQCCWRAGPPGLGTHPSLDHRTLIVWRRPSWGRVMAAVHGAADGCTLHSAGEISCCCCCWSCASIPLPRRAGFGAGHVCISWHTLPVSTGDSRQHNNTNTTRSRRISSFLTHLSTSSRRSSQAAGRGLCARRASSR